MHTHKLVSDKPRQKISNLCFPSVNSIHSTVCFNMHAGLLLPPIIALLSVSNFLLLSLTQPSSVLDLSQCYMSACSMNWLVYMEEVYAWLLEGVCVCLCVCVQRADVHFAVFSVTDPQTDCVGQWNIW